MIANDCRSDNMMFGETARTLKISQICLLIDEAAASKWARTCRFKALGVVRMSTRWHTFNCLILCLAACCSYTAVAEEPGAGYIPDPEIEKLIAAAIDPEKAIAFPAQ